MTGTGLHRVLLRRWYLVVLVIIGAVTVGLAAYVAIPPTYEVRGSVLLLPPPGGVGVGGNPFLNLGALELPSEVVSAYLSSDETREVIASRAPTAEYSVARDETTRGPVLAVTVEDVSPEAALSALSLLLDTVPDVLSTLQNSLDVTPENSVSSMVLAVDAESTPITRTTMRAVVAAVGVVLLLGFLLVVAVDGFLVRRRAERAPRGQHLGRQFVDTRRRESTESAALSVGEFRDEPRGVPSHAVEPEADGARHQADHANPVP